MDTKHYLDSTTVKSLLLSIVPTVYSIARMAGLDLPDGTLENIVNGIAAVLLVGSLVGAFIGRIKANKPLSFSK